MVVSSNGVRTPTVLADGWCDRTAAALATPVGRRASAANVSPNEVKVIYGAASFPMRPQECDLLVTLLNQRLTLRRTGIPKPSGPVPLDSVAVTHNDKRELARVSTGPVLSMTPVSEQNDSGEKAFTPTGRQVAGGCCAFKMRVLGAGACRVICSWIKRGKIDGLPRRDVAMRFTLLCDPLEVQPAAAISGFDVSDDGIYSPAVPRQSFTVKVKVVGTTGQARQTDSMTMAIPLCTTSDSLRRMILTELFGNPEGQLALQNDPTRATLRLMGRGRELAPTDLVAGQSCMAPPEALSVLALVRLPATATGAARQRKQATQADRCRLQRSVPALPCTVSHIGDRDPMTWSDQGRAFKALDEGGIPADDKRAVQAMSGIKARLRHLETQIKRCGDA